MGANEPLTEIVLEAKDLSFSYKGGGGTAVFSNLNFRLRRGEILVLLGANGAGKSTLLNCLSNMLVPDHGEVLLMGKRFSERTIQEAARIMGYVQQTHAPVFSYSVRDYVVLGRAPHLGLLGVPQKAEYDKADAVLARLKIEHLADKPFTQISGGERQQVQIARVLVQESEVILLDEPTNHLDYGNQLKILQMVSDLAADGITFVMTTHMPDHAIMLGGMAGILSGDGKMTVGRAGDVISAELLGEIYHTQLHLVYVDRVERLTCVPKSLRRP